MKDDRYSWEQEPRFDVWAGIRLALWIAVIIGWAWYAVLTGLSL